MRGPSLQRIEAAIDALKIRHAELHCAQLDFGAMLRGRPRASPSLGSHDCLSTPTPCSFAYAFTNCFGFRACMKLQEERPSAGCWACRPNAASCTDYAAGYYPTNTANGCQACKAHTCSTRPRRPVILHWDFKPGLRHLERALLPAQTRGSGQCGIHPMSRSCAAASARPEGSEDVADETGHHRYLSVREREPGDGGSTDGERFGDSRPESQTPRL